MISKLFCCILFFAGVMVFLGGCATDQPQSDSSQVSTIPWNRPEKWEGPGVLGSQLNPNQ